MSLLGMIEGMPKRVLEIGCGHGRALSFLKRDKRAEFTVGVELVPEVAAIARRNPDVDLVVTGDVEQIEFLFPVPEFDLIIASHVLEHVKDPWSLARRLNTLLNHEGQLIGSLPNFRNVQVTLPLLLFGDLSYTDEGILDWTHTKFFTKRTIDQLLKASGFLVDSIEPEFSGRASRLNSVTLGAFRNLLCFTYNFSARPSQKKQKKIVPDLICASS